VLRKRSIPKPKAVIGSSARRLNLRYAELLHLRRAVREAELLAGEVGLNPSPEMKKGKASPAVD
jgi:hypothetical protein